MKIILIIDDAQYAKQAFKHLIQAACNQDFTVAYSDGFKLPSDMPNSCELSAIFFHKENNVYEELKKRVDQTPHLLRMRYTGGINIPDSDAEKWYQNPLSDFRPLIAAHAQQLLDYLDHKIPQPDFF